MFEDGRDNMFEDGRDNMFEKKLLLLHLLNLKEISPEDLKN